MMKDYLRNRWIQVGIGLVVLGWGPLLTIIVLASLGLWPDPNPNPIGPGLLFFITAWPAIGCLAVGVLRVRAGHVEGDATSPRPHPLAKGGTAQTILRGVAAVIGFFFVLNGGAGLIMGADYLGSALELVVGALALYWAVNDRIPNWLRR